MSVSNIDIIEYNLNDNYRRYGFLSSVSLKSTTLNSFRSSTSIETKNIVVTNTVGITAEYEQIIADLIEVDTLNANNIEGFTLIGPVDFNNQNTENLVVLNLSADSGSIINMSTVESDQVVLNTSFSGSITLKADDFLTTTHTLTFPPNNTYGVLTNKDGSGDLSWLRDLELNKIGVGDVTAGGASNLTGGIESKLHVKGAENTTGGLLIESNVDGVNRLAVYADTTAGSSAIQKLAPGSLTFYDSTGTKDFEINSAGDGVFCNDLSVAGDTTFTGTLLAGITTIGSTLAVTGNTTMSGTLTVNNTADITGATTLGSTLAVTGNTTMSGTLTVNNTADITGATTLGSTLAVTGEASFTTNIAGEGRLTLRVRTETGGTTLDDDYILNVNNVGLANIDLPAIGTTYDGVNYIVIKQTANTVRIRADGTDMIHTSGSDVASYDLTGAAGELSMITNNGVKWFTLPS